MTGGRTAPRLAMIVVAGLVWGIVSTSPAHSQNGDEAATVYQQADQLYQAGKYVEAIPLAERYVKLTHARVGSDHADYATALHALGTVYKLTGRTNEAEAVTKRSLAIRERLGGPNHPIVADSLILLADIQRARGQRGEGEALVRRALAVRDVSLGPEHLLVADALAALTIACDRPECAVEKEAIFKRTIAIREKALGSRNRLSLGQSFCTRALFIGHRKDCLRRNLSTFMASQNGNSSSDLKQPELGGLPVQFGRNHSRPRPVSRMQNGFTSVLWQSMKKSILSTKRA